ncbi:MAG: DUF4880 domain-containing protein [Porphyrobacter sp.]|nr:DUF4880 domain-containing protein [Porphyrobacter sp.]
MQGPPDARILEQAIAWHLRLARGEDAAWAEFADWLEADPAHNDAYEAVADHDQELPALLAAADFPAPVEAHETGDPAQHHADLEAPAGRIGRGPPFELWRWGAMAASVALAGFVAVQLMPEQADTYAIATAAGQSRVLALADGSEVRLNGDSRIVLDRNDPRFARLERGEARFAVAHDPQDPFTVAVGDARLVDVGTVFNVVSAPDRMRVGVSEGAVRFEGFSRSVTLGAGDMLSASGSGAVTVARRSAATIGSWADGVLIYDAAPLASVAEDLSRALGVTLVLPAGMEGRAFTGVIQIDGGGETVRTRLEQLLGARIVADKSRWMVEMR